MKKTLALASIEFFGSVQSRCLVDDYTVEQYAQDMEAGIVFPPIVVFHDGKTNWLADGFHRFVAYEHRGKSKIPCEIKKGTIRDATLYSIRANNKHGLPRDIGDKKRCVELLLEDEKWSRWSDREIARRCAVGNTLVSKMRKTVSVRGEQIESDPKPRKVSRGDAVYEMKTTKIGKPSRSGKANGAAKSIPLEPAHVDACKQAWTSWSKKKRTEFLEWIGDKAICDCMDWEF